MRCLRPLERVSAAAAGYYVTTGIGPDLFGCAQDAVRGMVDRIVTNSIIDPIEAYMLCSVAMDLKISEAVNDPQYVVSAFLPKDLFPLTDARHRLPREQLMNAHTLDVVALRAGFASLRPRHGDPRPPAFLDGPGGTQVPDAVSDAVSRYFLLDNSNIEGEFPLTQRTDALITEARHYGGVFVGGDSRGIVFGQNMTTLNFNLARAVGRTMQAGDEIITTALDHEGNVSPWLLLAEDRGFTVHTVGLTDELLIDLEDLRSKLSDKTRIVAFSLASNAVGSVSDAKEIVRLAHSVGALAWADAVAYAPHRRLAVEEFGFDVVLRSPYKFFGPHLGMAWLRPDLAASWPAERVRPAGSEPPGHRFETGTLSHEALAGFLAAVDYLASLGQGADLAVRLDSAYEAVQSHEVALAERFLNGISAMPHVRLVGLGAPIPPACWHVRLARGWPQPCGVRPHPG